MESGRVSSHKEDWTDEAISAFWKALPSINGNLTRAQTVKALDAALAEQSYQMTIQRNKRLAERYNWIQPNEL
jgi:hypothetical protein